MIHRVRLEKGMNEDQWPVLNSSNRGRLLMQSTDLADGDGMRN